MPLQNRSECTFRIHFLRIPLQRLICRCGVPLLSAALSVRQIVSSNPTFFDIFCVQTSSVSFFRIFYSVILYIFRIFFLCILPHIRVFYNRKPPKKADCHSGLPDIVPVFPKGPALSDISPSSALMPQTISNISCDSYNSLESNHPSKVCITVGDMKISIGSSTSDEMILKILRAIRYA